MEVEEIVESLNAKQSSGGWLACCPAHDDKDPSLSISVQNGKLLLNCFAGCTFEEILGSLGIEKSIKHKHYRNTHTVDYQKNIERMSEVWGQTVDLADCLPVQKYLESRRILLQAVGASQHKLRAHPALKYWDTTGNDPILIGEFPAMVALVQNPMGEIVSVHRTYLTNEGQKISGFTARKMMPPSGRRAPRQSRIELNPATEVLGVGEGIESVLAFQHLMSLKKIDVPVWSCISAEGLKHCSIPKTVSTVFIIGDNDESKTGQTAAYRLKDQLFEKQDIHVCIPSKEGEDMADVLEDLETDKTVLDIPLEPFEKGVTS